MREKDREKERAFEAAKLSFWTYSDMAEWSGSIDDFAENIYKSIEGSIVDMAALVTVLNHKCWFWYDHANHELSYIYSELYYKYNELTWNWLEANGTEEEKDWYFDTMD